MTPPNRRRQPGFTLIELIMFIVIVSVGLAGILKVLDVTVAASADPLIAKQSVAIAEAILDEVLLKDYQNDLNDAANTSTTLGCTPNTPTSCRANNPTDRQNYNDVTDYNGWSQSANLQPDGSTGTILASYTVSISVGDETLTGIATKRVAVTVTGGGNSFTLVGHRAAYDNTPANLPP